MRGFKHGILKSDNSSMYTYSDDLEGFITALVLREKVKLIYDSVDLEVERLKKFCRKLRRVTITLMPVTLTSIENNKIAFLTLQSKQIII